MSIWPIAVNTFRETVRDKILYNLVVFALALIVLSVFLGRLTIGERMKVAVDVGLASISIVGTLIAVFVGINLVSKEIDRRTIYTIISKPVPRSHFLIGKYLGLLLTLAVNIGVMALCVIGIIYYIGGVPTPTVLWALAMIFVELCVITSMALLFSSFTTATLSAIFTLALVVIGHFAHDFRFFGQRAKDPAARRLYEWLYNLMPDFERFNLKAEASHGLEIDSVLAGWAIVTGVAYIAAFLTAAILIFSRRDFK